MDPKSNTMIFLEHDLCPPMPDTIDHIYGKLIGREVMPDIDIYTKNIADFYVGIDFFGDYDDYDEDDYDEDEYLDWFDD